MFFHWFTQLTNMWYNIFYFIYLFIYLIKNMKLYWGFKVSLWGIYLEDVPSPAGPATEFRLRHRLDRGFPPSSILKYAIKNYVPLIPSHTHKHYYLISLILLTKWFKKLSVPAASSYYSWTHSNQGFSLTISMKTFLCKSPLTSTVTRPKAISQDSF